MAGYHNYSMSNNAVDAYSAGMKPISKFKKDDFKKHGLDYPLAFFRWLAKENRWNPSEWHHTSKHYNETNFYCIEGLMNQLEDNYENLNSLFSKYKESKSKKPEDKGVKVICEYVEFEGSRRHPKPIEYNDVPGVLKGNWIHLKCGKRKNANGRHMYYKVCK